jgi:hypothetical protein
MLVLTGLKSGSEATEIGSVVVQGLRIETGGNHTLIEMQDEAGGLGSSELPW